MKGLESRLEGVNSCDHEDRIKSFKHELQIEIDEFFEGMKSVPLYKRFLETRDEKYAKMLRNKYNVFGAYIIEKVTGIDIKFPLDKSNWGDYIIKIEFLPEETRNFLKEIKKITKKSAEKNIPEVYGTFN